MKTKQLISAGALTIAAVMSTAAQAATCNGTQLGNICTLAGPNVTWQYDVVAMAGALSWFDAPTLVGDNVRFLPPSFRAESLNGAGAVTASANFIFTHVFRNDGGTLLGFTSADIGDYAITNNGTVTGSLYLQAADNNNILGYVNSTNNFGPTSVPTGGVATPWTISTSVNSGTTPTSPFISPFPSTNLAVNIQDTLTATTTLANSDAWIQKKINIDVLVPVPASAWLFGSALGLLGLRRRTR